MRTGVFLFGGVELDDAGAGPPVPTERRATQDEMWQATERILDMVVASGILFGAVLAERTKHIRIGTMFNVVPQWHPLKLAGDFAFLQIPNFPGDSYDTTEEQLVRYAEQVRPLLR